MAAGTWNYVHERSIADHYDAFVANTPLCQLDRRFVADLFPVVGSFDASQRRPVVLDLGCGSGRCSLELASLGYDVVGIDLSERMLQVMMAKPHLESAPGSICPLRTNLVQLDCLAAEVADHAICLFGTLGMVRGRHHRRAFLSHVARTVRDGGKFLLHVHNRWAALREPNGYRHLVNSFWRSLQGREEEFGDSTYAYRGLENMFMHRFSKRELMKDLIHCGFEIENVWPVAINGDRVVDSISIPGGFIVLARVSSKTV